jgi:hypothetical protein
VQCHKSRHKSSETRTPTKSCFCRGAREGRDQLVQGGSGRTEEDSVDEELLERVHGCQDEVEHLLESVQLAEVLDEIETAADVSLAV